MVFKTKKTQNNSIKMYKVEQWIAETVIAKCGETE